MYDIDLNKLKILLKFDGIDVDFSDEELEILVKSKLVELESLIGVKIFPSDKTKVMRKFKGRLLELNYYPVLSVVDVFVNDKCLPDCEYNVNYNLGIIYFRKYHFGSIRVNYTIGFDDVDFEYLILPLLKDMVGYSIRYGKVNEMYGGINGIASSLKEGDVSINFSSNNLNGVGVYGYDGGINNRIEDLKKKYGYSARVRLLQMSYLIYM